MLLAVESGLRDTATKVMNEAKRTFERHDLFIGKDETYEKLNADGRSFDPIKIKATTTVPDKIDYIHEHLVRYFDSIYQRDLTNTLAKADLVINGQVIEKDVPATFLLFLEKQFKEVRNVYAKVSTLDNVPTWTESATEDNIWETVSTREKTEKTIVPIELSKATDKHAAQVQTITKDIPIGTWNIKISSGQITSKEKSRLLSNLDQMIRDITACRCNANDQEVPNVHIAGKLFDMISSNFSK